MSVLGGHCQQRTANICSPGISAENIPSMQAQVYPREPAQHCQGMHLLLQIIADVPFVSTGAWCEGCWVSSSQHRDVSGVLSLGSVTSGLPQTPPPICTQETACKQVTDTLTCLPVLPPLLNHSCLESQSHLVSVSQTVCLHSLPRLSRSLHTSLLCCRNVCSPPRFLLLTMAAPSSGPGEMQPLGKQHWVDSSTQ